MRQFPHGFRQNDGEAYRPWGRLETDGDPITIGLQRRSRLHRMLDIIGVAAADVSHGQCFKECWPTGDGTCVLNNRTYKSGEVTEWPNVPVSKTGVPARVPRVRIPPSPLQNPGFPRVFCVSGQLLWHSCTTRHGHACGCRVVWCAALPPCESPESPQNPRFHWENRFFCSGGGRIRTSYAIFEARGW